MKDLRTLNVNIEFGNWSGQLPCHNKSYMVQNKTAEKIIKAANEGKRIIVGNHSGGAGEIISSVNSRFHGWTIRTIRAV